MSARGMAGAGLLAGMVLLAACSTADESGEARADGAGTSVPASSSVTSTTHGQDHDHRWQFDLVETVRRDDGWYEFHYAPRGTTDVGRIEVSAYPLDAEPTDAQRAAADDLRARVVAASSRWPTRDDALAAGFQAWQGVDTFHVVHLGHVDDGVDLDPERPEMLMYGDQDQLLAVLFFAESNDADGPQVGGPLTRWHYHPTPTGSLLCYGHGGRLPMTTPPDLDRRCPDGMVATRHSSQMLHVWVVDHPEGPYASDMAPELFSS